MLVDANIRYRKAVAGRPEAIASRDKLSGDLDRLARGSKARIKLEVTVGQGMKSARSLPVPIWCCPARNTARSEGKTHFFRCG